MRRVIVYGLAALMLTSVVSVHAEYALAGATNGSHLVVYAGASNTHGRPSTLHGVEDAEGNLVMFTFVQNGRLYVSDGEEDGTARSPIQLPDFVGTSWRRFDVLLFGDTYTLLVNQATTVTARTFTHATRGHHLADPHDAYNAKLGHGWPSETIRRAGERVDDNNMHQDSTFRQPLDATGFGVVQNGGFVRIEPDLQGHLSAGHLVISKDSTSVVTYAYADRPSGAPSRYHVLADFTPTDTFVPPAGLAIMAGLIGPLDAPQTTWSIVLEKIGIEEWAIAYRAPDGAHTRLSAESATTAYKSVHAIVDESAGTLNVQVDGGPVLTFTQAMQPAERIGFGDVTVDALTELIEGGLPGRSRYDNIAVYDAT